MVWLLLQSDSGGLLCVLSLEKKSLFCAFHLNFFLALFRLRFSRRVRNILVRLAYKVHTP